MRLSAWYRCSESALGGEPGGGGDRLARVGGRLVMGGVVVAHPLADGVEVEVRLAAQQAHHHADYGAGAVGGQGGEQHRVVVQEAGGEDQHGDHRHEAGDEARGPAQEAEHHQADDDAATHACQQLEEEAAAAVQGHQFEARHAEEHHGHQYRGGEGLVGDPVPEAAGDHREDDGPPQRAHEHQHHQDIQGEAGEDDPQHGGDDHGQAAHQQHALGVGLAAGDVLAVDVGHHDRRQRREVRVGGGGERADHQDEEQRDEQRRQVAGDHLRDQVVHVAVERLHAGGQGHQADHAQADDDGAVAHGGGEEGGLDVVLVHREEALGDGLVADGVGQHGHEEGGALVEDGVRGEEVGLLRRQVVEAGDQLGRAAHGEEHRGNDHDGNGHERHQLGEIGQHRGAEAGPQGIEQHADAGDDHPGLEGERREHRDQRTGGGEVDHQADHAAQHVGERQYQLAGGAVAGVNQLAQGVDRKSVV